MTKTLNQNTFTGEFSYSLDNKGRLNLTRLGIHPDEASAVRKIV